MLHVYSGVFDFVEHVSVTYSNCWQVLAESEQMRREADDIGPRAELDHWKKRMSRFNFLLEQVRARTHAPTGASTLWLSE